MLEAFRLRYWRRLFEGRRVYLGRRVCELGWMITGPEDACTVLGKYWRRPANGNR